MRSHEQPRKAHEALGARIKQARESAGISQADIARKLLVSPSTPWRWEDGRQRPRPADRKRLAGLLGVSVEWLMTGEGEGPAPVEPEPLPATGTDGV